MEGSRSRNGTIRTRNKSFPGRSGSRTSLKRVRNLSEFERRMAETGGTNDGCLSISWFRRDQQERRQHPVVAQIGRMFVSQFFFPDEMEFQGKPEL
jgi:hypothetical protein